MIQARRTDAGLQRCNSRLNACGAHGSPKYRGHRREPKVKPDGRCSADGEVRTCPPSSPLPPPIGTTRRDPEPLSRRRPLSSTGAGVSMRRFAFIARLSAGPFDAVIDIFESKTVKRRCLLLLPALGLLRALFCRRLRLGLSLLRHAALLAMMRWRCRSVPARIASTATGLH